MKRKHMVLIYILFMFVAIFSACSKKQEKSAPIILDQIENSSEAENVSSNTAVTPTQSPTDELTIEGEDNSTTETIALPENSNNTEHSSEADNTSKSDLQDNAIDDSMNNETDNSNIEDTDTVNNDTKGSDNEDSNDVNSDSDSNDTVNSDSDSNDAVNEPTENNDIQSSNIASKDIINDANKSSDQNNPDTKTKKIIAIDAGHQRKGNYDVEPIGPGSKTTKAKVSSGTQGKFTGVAEYVLNLVIAKKVEAELIDRGYEVFMIRETHKVNLSNKERAEMANESGADIFIRIHADGSTNPDVNGVSTLYPSKNNPYVSSLSKASHALSDFIVDSICESTSAKNRGAIARDDMSGINWCALPVTIIEMGYMSNKKEDKLMQTEKYQNKIVKGICDGIDKYYE